MSNLNDSVSYILEKGAQLIAISPELSQNADEFASNTSTEFPIISDPTNTIMNAFDVTFKATDAYSDRIMNRYEVSIADNNGSEEAFLPVPATYIIQPDGTINYVHFDLNYRRRASVKDILSNL